MLGVGGWHLGDMSEHEAQMTIEVALEGGVRFFDTADTYHAGGSERRLGQFLVPKYRDDVYIMTKTAALDAAGAREHLENSLRRLRTDYLDLWQMHAVESSDDVDNRINNGVLEVLVKAKETGKARHIGFTGHTRSAAHQRMLEKTDVLDTCQMPVNLADPLYESFIESVLPMLIKRKVGVLAMKTLSGGRLVGRTHAGTPSENPPLVPNRVSLQEAIHFVWSYPVSVLITGSRSAAQLKEMIDLARSFIPMDAAERSALMGKIADLAGRRVEAYKA
jgi:aryl-alcohol dehydrogenase-like predicted oxidoreductase